MTDAQPSFGTPSGRPHPTLGAGEPTKPQQSSPLDAHPPIVKLYPQLRARLAQGVPGSGASVTKIQQSARLQKLSIHAVELRQ